MKQAAASRTKGAEDGVDPLAAVISLLRPRTVLSKVISGAGRWSVRYEAHEHPGFCVMLEGSCFLDVDGVGEIVLEAGDFLLLPATPGFTMSSHRGVSARRRRGDSSRVGELRHGSPSEPPTMRQLGGYFHFDSANAPLVLRLLPSTIVVRRDEPGATRLRSLVERIGDEATSDRLGRELVLERLVEVLLVEALRYRPVTTTPPKTSAEDGTPTGLLAGLGDPALARALRHMHEDVARRWTVADLARTAGMSRASFAQRFTRTVGVPPMEYLLEWRIAMAKDLLRREVTSLTEVAEAIGYQSASAFSTAFSRHTGCAPSEFARAMRASRGG